MYTKNCRICLSDQCDIVTLLFTSEEDQNSIKSLSETGLMYLECLRIELIHNEEFPNHICNYCKLQLNVFHNFMMMAKRSYDKFTDFGKLKIKSEKDVPTFPDLEELDEPCDPDGDAHTSILNSSRNSEIEYLDSELDEAPSFDAVSGIGSSIFNEFNEGQQEDNIMDDCVVEYLDDDDLIVPNVKDEFFEVKSESYKDSESEKEGDAISYDSNDTDHILEPLLKAPDNIPTFYKLEMLDGNIEVNDQIVNQVGKRKRGIETIGIPKDYECKQCNFIFTSADLLREHYANHPCRLDCEVCGKKFKTQVMYQSHMNVHNGLPAFKCEMCDKTFNFRSNYQTHMLLHTNERPFQCDMCDKGFRSKWDLIIHTRAHNDIRKYECKVCGKRFRVSSHLTSHQYTHAEEKLFECDICHQKYNSPRTLKQHKNTVHSNTFRFYCSQCDKKFKRKHHVLSHLKTHFKHAEANKTKAIEIGYGTEL